jgi:hypothetical protein
MQFGRTYEEFEIGAVYKHWPGKTVSEYDDHLFCLLTMNHHPLHLDAHYAVEATDFGRNVVVGNYRGPRERVVMRKNDAGQSSRRSSSRRRGSDSAYTR